MTSLAYMRKLTRIRCRTIWLSCWTRRKFQLIARIASCSTLSHSVTTSTSWCACRRSVNFCESDRASSPLWSTAARLTGSIAGRKKRLCPWLINSCVASQSKSLARSRKRPCKSSFLLCTSQLKWLPTSSILSCAGRLMLRLRASLMELTCIYVTWKRCKTITTSKYRDSVLVSTTLRTPLSRLPI